MHQHYRLSLTDAQRVIGVIESELVGTGKGAAVAVVDAHGELIAFFRTDTCPLPPIYNAQNKAYTAARLQDETANIGSEGFPMTNLGDLRYCPWGGGVPLRYGGAVVGAVGVSGLPEAEDIVLAKLGAAQIGG